MVNDKKNAEREFSLIKEGLKLNKARIAEFLKQRVCPGEWQLTETEVPVDCEGEQETIDMVFSCETGRNSKKMSYILVDISVPHLGIGQQYTLPTKGKAFQASRDVPSNRLKKAIILIRRGIDGVKALPARIRCPIIDVQLENIVAKRSDSKNKKDERTASETKAEVSSKDSAKNKENANETLNADMMFALKEAVVHDYISTSYKRNNKYVCRGLWKWVEREIMDPNVHFFFIILSSIYQGKTGEILSKKFKTLESLINNPDEVYTSIFSRENPLVDDIKRDSERHKKAITKLLLCFSQTSPFEYLKSMFLKEFRTSADSSKSRMSVYNTLQQLLERCGFEGEKEVAYPLEILDELKIFREILCGDYTKLRIDNAYKKLKHLIPQVEWTPEDIYKLRKELAKSFLIPENEFNLNAYLPQAFYQDAKVMAEQKRENVRSNGERTSSKRSVPQETVKQPEQILEEMETAQQEDVFNKSTEKLSDKTSRKRSATYEQEDENVVPQKKVAKQAVGDFEIPPKKKRKSDETESAYEAAMQAERMTPITGKVQEPISEGEKEIEQQEEFMPSSQINSDDSSDEETIEENENYDESDDTSIEESNDGESSVNDEQAKTQNSEYKARDIDLNEYYEYDVFGTPIKAYRRGDCDESRHRNFESFGGVMYEDIDAMKMAIAMTNYEIERLARAARAPKISDEERVAIELESEDEFMPIKKSASRLGSMTNRPAFNRNDGNRRFSSESDNQRPQRHMAPEDRNNNGRRVYNRDSKYQNQHNSNKRYFNNNNRRSYANSKTSSRRGR